MALAQHTSNICNKQELRPSRAQMYAERTRGDPNAPQQTRKHDQLKDTSSPEHVLCSLFLPGVDLIIQAQDWHQLDG